MTWAANLILLAASLLGIYHEHAAPTPATPTALPVLPSPTPAPATDLRALICAYSWPCAEALGVVYGNARCPWGESSGDPNARNGTNIGLFQINYAAHYDKVESLEMLFIPEVNVAVAYRIWSDQGWAPWSCRP